MLWFTKKKKKQSDYKYNEISHDDKNEIFCYVAMHGLPTDLSLYSNDELKELLLRAKQERVDKKKNDRSRIDEYFGHK